MFRASLLHWAALYGLAILFLLGAFGLEYAHQFCLGRIPDVMCKTLHAVSYVIFFADMITLVWMSVIGMLTIAVWSLSEFRHVASRHKERTLRSTRPATAVEGAETPKIEP